MVRACTCKHPAQDSIHGRGQRVMNICKGGTHVRCTVCRAEYGLSASKIVETKQTTKKKGE